MVEADIPFAPRQGHARLGVPVQGQPRAVRQHLDLLTALRRLQVQRRARPSDHRDGRRQRCACERPDRRAERSRFGLASAGRASLNQGPPQGRRGDQITMRGQQGFAARVRRQPGFQTGGFMAGEGGGRQAIGPKRGLMILGAGVSVFAHAGYPSPRTAS